jgi:hypothetical protein
MQPIQITIIKTPKIETFYQLSYKKRNLSHNYKICKGMTAIRRCHLNQHMEETVTEAGTRHKFLGQ